jgi:cytoskeletal protein RodZ
MIARMDIESELDCAQQISGQLEEARQARGLSRKEVAYQLMLSADQINCLETRSLKSFYNPQYYVLAARKYAAFLGVKMAQPQVSEIAPTAVPVVSTGHPPPAVKSKALVGRALFWALAVLTIISISVVYVARDGFHERDASPGSILPAVPVQDVAPLPSPASAPSLSSPSPPKPAPSKADSPQLPAAHPVVPHAASEGEGKAELQLNFSAATWVSIYRRDGGHEQKVYGPDETLKLEAETLAELIIGNAPATRLSVGNSEINLQRFTNPESKVARITGQNLRDLGTKRP